MANINAELSIVDSNGDVTTLYPKTYASNVLMSDGNTLQTTLESMTTSLNGKAASSHTHDDRYYTETEVDNLLSNVNGGNPGAIPINPTAAEKANLTMWIEV